MRRRRSFTNPRRNSDAERLDLERRAKIGDLAAIEALAYAAARSGDPELAREAWFLAADLRDKSFPLGSSPADAPPDWDEIERVVAVADRIFHEQWDAYLRRNKWGIYSGPTPAPNPLRRNSDADLRALERAVEESEGDPSLVEELVRKAKRVHAWGYVNAAMGRANYPTWNKLAPWAYAGAADWPADVLGDAARRAHDMLSRVAGEVGGFHRFTFRDHLYPLLDVLIGDAEPVRYVDQPGVHRDPYGRSVADTSAVVRAWVAERISNVAQERRRDLLVGVLDREEGSITLADAHVDGVFDLPFHWYEESTEQRGGSWGKWARNTEAFDRVRLPIDVARRWLAEARRVWGTRPEGFLDLVRYADQAALRHEFPPGHSIGAMVFEGIEHVGYEIQRMTPSGHGDFVVTYRLDGPYDSPAEAAWAAYLRDEAMISGFRVRGLDYAQPLFDPDSWEPVGGGA